jgi:branched-chain amino acid transport system substrate-binding protein
MKQIARLAGPSLEKTRAARYLTRDRSRAGTGRPHTLLLATVIAVLGLLALPVGSMAAGGCELKIGAMGPMSGPAAQWGLANEGAAVLAAAEVNSAGGLKVGGETCNVTVITRDAFYTAEGGAAAASNLASQGVKYIIGPVGSPEVAGMKPITVRNNMLAMVDSFAKNAIGPQWPMVFHLGSGPSDWAPPIIRAAKQQFRIESVVVVAPNDQGGTDIGTVDAEVYKKNGIQTTEEYYDRGTTNFAPFVARILNHKPSAVDVASSPPGDAGVIIKQLRQAGFTGPIGRNGGPGTAEIARVAGGYDVLKDFYWYECVPTADPKVQEISAQYKKLLGKDAPQNTFFWLWTAGSRMMLKAIAKAGTITDTAKVAETLRNMPVEDPNLGKGLWTGKAFYGINQELSFPFGVGMIVNGKEVGVKRVEVTGQ